MILSWCGEAIGDQPRIMPISNPPSQSPAVFAPRRASGTPPHLNEIPAKTSFQAGCVPAQAYDGAVSISKRLGVDASYKENL